ncbi:methyltransferase domain-containing protein [Aureococcus anophagefferens]|nr:methyltransferase domain-containing protein [Aureococcus anophagefferens]
MLGDARDATAGDGAGVNRAALVPFSNVERRVKNVTPDLAVEPLDKVRRIFDAHAKQIDVEINGVSDGPMLRALSSLGGCVGLVFGQFSEASKDVSSLLADVATALSESRWISMGCACPDQAKALLSNDYAVLTVAIQSKNLVVELTIKRCCCPTKRMPDHEIEIIAALAAEP